jgi:hypothetical protein
MSYVTDLPGYTSDNSGRTIGLWGKDQSMADTGSFSPGRGFRVDDWWDIDDADLVPFLDVCGGITELWGSVYWPRMVPLRHKRFPFALCVSADFKLYTLDRAGTPSDYRFSKDRARIHISYEAPTYPIDGADAFLSYEKYPGSRPLPLTGATAGSGTFSRDPMAFNSTTNITYTLHRLTVDPSTALEAYLGYSNSDTWRGHAPGELIFRGPQVRLEARIGGFQTYQAGLKFEKSRIGWNSFVNDVGTLTTATYNSGTDPAPTTSFATLFGF